MRTRTNGIHLVNGERIADRWYRGERIYCRLGKVSQEQAETWLTEQQAAIEAKRKNDLREGASKLFQLAAGKYLRELENQPDVRTMDAIAGHILLLNQWVGDVPLNEVCNDSFEDFKADRLAGRSRDGKQIRKVKPATVNRSLEVVCTVLNRAARVWRSNGKPWLSTAPLIEMLNEAATRRKPRPLSWAEQGKLFALLPPHLERMALFAVNTGARDDNICGLRWAWERDVPEIGRSVFVVPAAEFKGKRDHVLILNDVAWQIVQSQRGKHPDFVFVYRRERVKNLDREPEMQYHRITGMGNTAFQTARTKAGLSVRVHDFRHTFGLRLRAAGVAAEDRKLLLGHSVEGDMEQLYATAEITRLVEMANKVQDTRDRTTLLRVVNG